MTPRFLRDRSEDQDTEVGAVIPGTVLEYRNLGTIAKVAKVLEGSLLLFLPDLFFFFSFYFCIIILQDSYHRLPPMIVHFFVPHFSLLKKINKL